MPRKKKDVVEEVVTSMNDDAMNPPVEEVAETPEIKEETQEIVAETPEIQNESQPVLKQVNCSATAVNVRRCENGDVLFTIKNHSNVLVEQEKDGWAKITGYIMSDLLK